MTPPRTLCFSLLLALGAAVLPAAQAAEAKPATSHARTTAAANKALVPTR